jgi:hypothetical protein
MSPYSLELDLCFQIIPEKSKFSVKGTKIEIRMAKKVHVKWPALEGEVRHIALMLLCVGRHVIFIHAVRSISILVTH